MATFDQAASASLARVMATYADRGTDYGDSWAIPNRVTTLTEYVLGLHREPDHRAWLRLLQMAVLIDIKDSRLSGGGSVDDSLIDSIAYRAAFTDLLREYTG